ncbi:MAG: site-specific integrase [Metakosakonia sp.]|nr:site-specific integrase [Phytobacter sp.]MBV8875941.1 site-specific integrase [Phytobacter sp.]
MKKYLIKSFMMKDGTRSCLLYNGEQEPLLYPNLYLEDEVRRKRNTATTALAVAKSISILLVFLDQRGINIESAINEKRFLTREDIKSIIYYMSGKINSGNVVNINEKDRLVSSGTIFYRIKIAIRYITWLCEYLLGSKAYIDEKAKLFLRMLNGYCPKKKIDENFYTKRHKAIDERQKTALFKCVSVNSESNIYTKSVRKRNELIIILLYSLGLRKGELLNMRISDIDFSVNGISIIRRHDDKFDSRVNQPVVKTLNRVMKVSDWIMGKLINYIKTDRRNSIGKKQHDFLLVNHRGGKLSGLPMSIDAYEKTIQKIKEHDPLFKDFSGHALRHTWNHEFSLKLENIDSSLIKINPELIRSFAMGWSPNSQMAAIYNNKYYQEKMFKLLAIVQESIYTDLKGLVYE